MADLIKPDLCVIGAGAQGISLAVAARQRGLAVALVDVAGTAAIDPGQGSLQRAALLASADRAQAIRTAGRVGLDNAEPKPNFRAIGEHAATVAAGAAARDADERLAALGVTLLAGSPSFVDRQTLLCGEASIRARHFALATGAVPLVPALPGLDQVPYFTTDSIGTNIRKLSHLVVIGGEPVAFELAQAYARLGSQVTLVPQGALLPGFDPELVAILAQALRDEGVVIRQDGEVSGFVKRNQGTGVSLRVPGGEDSLDVSHILLAMGRVPVLDEALLGKLKLRREPQRPDHLLLGPSGQTSNRRISAIAGAAGQHQPHIAARQAGLLLERLLGLGNGRLDAHLPRIVATQPALAEVGMAPGATLRQGKTILRANLAESEAARAGGQPHGAVRLVSSSNGAVLGAGVVGPGAAEIMAALTLAMSRGLTLSDLSRLALPAASPAAALLDLANQHLAARKPSGWSQRLPGLGRFRS